MDISEPSSLKSEVKNWVLFSVSLKTGPFLVISGIGISVLVACEFRNPSQPLAHSYLLSSSPSYAVPGMAFQVSQWGF